MGYSNFKKLKTVVKNFNLATRSVGLFDKIQIVPVNPTAWLLETLDMARLFPLTNEKNKSERLVSPILLEVGKAYMDNISFFSGESIDIDSALDLSGPCDFFFSLHPPQSFMEAPIISLAEAKNEDMEYGMAQCAAQLYGARLFNEAEGKNLPVLHGCATNGVEWQFMRFEKDTFYIDTKIYTDLKEILGVWHYVISLYL